MREAPETTSVFSLRSMPFSFSGPVRAELPPGRVRTCPDATKHRRTRRLISPREWSTGPRWRCLRRRRRTRSGSNEPPARTFPRLGWRLRGQIAFHQLSRTDAGNLERPSKRRADKPDRSEMQAGCEHVLSESVAAMSAGSACRKLGKHGKYTVNHDRGTL